MPAALADRTAPQPERDTGRNGKTTAPRPAGRDRRRLNGATMDALRTAYDKTALARLGIPFERAMELESVRIALEGSVRRSQPQPTARPAHAAGGR